MQENKLESTYKKEEEDKKRQVIEKQARVVLNQIVEKVQFMMSSGPYQSYFLLGAEKISKLRKVAQKYHYNLLNQIEGQIQVGKITIPKVKSQYKVEKKAPVSNEQLIETRKIEIQKRKKDVISSLQQLLKEEGNLIKENNSLLAKSRSLNKSQPSFHQSPESKHELKLALRKNKEFERQLKQKQDQIHRRIFDIQQQNKRKREQVIQKLKQEHLHELQRRKKKIEEEKNHQKMGKEKCIEFVGKIKPKKYIFEEMSEKDREKLRIKQQQRNQRLKKHIQSQRRVNWSQLKQHQQRYLHIIQQNKQEWMRKYEQIMGSRTRQNYGTSVFSQRIKQAQNEKQFQEQQKNRAKKQFIQRIKSYSSNILTNHRPKHFIKSQINPPSSIDKRQSLDRQQERVQGLLFLSEAKKKHKLIDSAVKKPIQLKGSSSLPAIKQTVYKDYLKEQPKRIGNQTNSSRFHSVLTERKGQWASNAKSILQRMDRANKTGDKLLVSSALKKIELLNALI